MKQQRTMYCASVARPVGGRVQARTAPCFHDNKPMYAGKKHQIKDLGLAKTVLSKSI